jgi:hypothetical protein
MMRPAAKQNPKDKETPRIFIGPYRVYELDGVLGYLARKFGLDTHGNTLLTRRAAIAMKFIAVLLVVNFLFDMGAWTLLLNAVLGSGLLDWGFHSLFAVGAALLISIAIFIYEQQFMTTDTSAERKRWLPAMALRLFVVFGAAVVTSQPVELIFFNGPIARRIHEESVRMEAIARLKQFEDSRKLQTGAGETYEGKEVEKAKLKLEAAEIRLGEIEASLRATESSLSAARDRVGRLQAQLNRTPLERRASVLRSLEGARASVSRLEGQAASLRQERDTQNATVTSLKENLPGIEKPLKDLLASARDDEKRLDDWMALVRTSNPGGKITESAGDWTYQDQSYDFFQQLRVLSDLTNGRPPRWPSEASQAYIETLATNFKFKGLSEKEQQEDAVNRMIDAEFFNKSYWAVFVIALVIPTLMIAFKLLQPRELREYYSSRKQMESGNYGVIRF